MTEPEFWQVIDLAIADSGSAHRYQCDYERFLTPRLTALGRDRFGEWAEMYVRKFNELYTWTLWGALWAALGGGGDDSFDDFRQLLVLFGHDVFQAALNDPDSLAVVLTDDANCLCVECAANIIGTIEEANRWVFPITAPPFKRPSHPAGQKWEADDIPKLYPRLAAKYGQW